MADMFYVLDGLNPGQALELLAETAEATASTPEFLGHTQIHIVTYAGLGVNVKLSIPDFYAWRDKKRIWGKPQEILIDKYRHLTGQEARRVTKFEPALPFIPGVLSLLRQTFLPNAGQAGSIQKDENEYLLVGRNLDIERISQIFAEIRYDATWVRAAVGREVESSTNYVLFYVKDDRRRRSSFVSLMKAGYLSDLFTLDSYTLGESVIFLPVDVYPEEEALFCLVKLLRCAPGLFGVAGVPQISQLLAALFPREGGSLLADDSILLHLAGLRFFDRPLINNTSPDITNVELHRLESSVEMEEQLRDAIDQAEPRIGYNLELRHTRFKEPSEDERKRLLDQRVELDYQLAYLDSIAEIRPILLRFTQDQLPAMAAQIRSYPGGVLQNGVIRYGFQATVREPAGLHYLFINPLEASQVEIDPLLTWENLDTPPIRFWLDPFWAHFYHGQGNNCLVFVPDGFALFPSMHEWDVKQMDQYMRDILGVWFHGHNAISSIPDHPIYLFHPEKPGSKNIDISVLDLNQFVPLKTQLGWINDNLTILDDLKIQPFLTEMADAIRRRDLALRVVKEASQANKVFQTQAQESVAFFAHQTNVLTQGLTQQLQELANQFFTSASEARKLNQELSRLKSLYENMKRVTEEVERTKGATEKEINDLNEYTNALYKAVQNSINKADESRKQLSDKVHSAIAEIKKARADVLSKLGRL
jgi:hypothetical protein